MLKDLRHAIRVLLHAKGWTAVVLLSLALGIGANTAIFSAINGLLITTVPVKDPDGLVRLRWGGRNDMVTSSSEYGFAGTGPDGQRLRATFSYPMYQQFRADNKTMTDLSACAPYGRVNVVVDGQAEVATAFISTGNYYDVLSVRARIGRTLTPDDDNPSSPAAAVISSRYWHSRFTTDPNVIGRTVRVNNVPVTIVGVLDPAFTGIQRTVDTPPDLAFPLSLDALLNPPTGSPRSSQPTYWWLQVVGRLAPGATAAQVEGNLGGAFQQAARAGLESYLQSIPEAERSTAMNRGRTHIPRLVVGTARRGVYDVNTNERRAATILAVIVALVLLIVCANVANLLLSRATTRQKELSVRLSLGATRGRLIRQLLTESLLLAAVGGVLGIVVGYWGKQLLPGPPGQASYLDWRVLLFVLAVTALTGIVFGIAPALRATGGDVNAALKQTSRNVAGSRTLLGRSLLIVQVAISLVLLVGAGLFLRTLHNLRDVEVGFNPNNLLLFRLDPRLNRYEDTRALAMYEQLFERIGAVPGVRSVALTHVALLSGSSNTTSIFVRGRDYPNAREQRDSIHRLVVSPNFFETLEIPILAGRGFTAADNESAPKVVLINDAAAKKYFPGENPIGQRFGSSVETSGELEIVGTVRDTKYDSVRDPAPPTMYVPYRQTRAGGAFIVVRSAGEAAAITASVREAVRQVEPNLPMMDVSTQLEQVERRFQQERMFAAAYTLFGALAMLLASIGLFGLMSYNVSRRTNEIGIRMALGAQRGDVLRLVMRESMILVAAGIVIGAGAALWASRFVASQLFGLQATDAATIAAAVGVMILTSAPAGFLPARRASTVDPMVALRYD
jgi:predicted permease